MLFSKIKKVNIIYLVSVSVCILCLAIILSHCLKTSDKNIYFFNNGNTFVEYEGYFVPLSGNEIEQKIKLNIRLIEKFEEGDLYILKLDALEVSDPLDQISSEHRTLGYFFVTNDKIYRSLLPYDKDYSNEDTQMVINSLKNDTDTFLNTCDIVLVENGSSDVPDKNNWHKYVEKDGNRRIFHLYNDDVSGTKYYEEIVWEKHKGITCYKSGTGSMLMHIEFGLNLEN